MLQRFYCNNETNENTQYTEMCIDEAGRGCLFGRVFVACVILPKDPESFSGKDIKDSKKFSSKTKIRQVAEYIKTHALAYSIASIDESVIDEINILQAVMRGMHQCIQNLLNSNSQLNIRECIAIVDGNYFIPFRQFDENEQTIVEMPFATVEKGDGTYMGIAAASILAKTARDDYVLEMCQRHPDLVTKYGLNTNMGYGTKAHIEGIKKHGITEWHRKSFHIK